MCTNTQTFPGPPAKSHISPPRNDKSSDCFSWARAGLTAWLLTQTSQSCQTQKLLLAHCLTQTTLCNKNWIVHELLLMNLLVVPELVERANTSLEDFCPAAASLAPDRLTGIRACSGWTKKRVTMKGSQKIRRCSRHGSDIQNIIQLALVVAKHIPRRAQGGLQGWTTERKKCTNGSKMGKFCQVRTKIICVPVSTPVKAALLCLWERTYTWTWSCTHTDTLSSGTHSPSWLI